MVNWFDLKMQHLKPSDAQEINWCYTKIYIIPSASALSSNITKNFNQMKQKSLVANNLNPTMSNWKLESLASGTNQSCGIFHRAKVLHHSAQRVAWEVEEWHLEADKSVNTGDGE
jgi:hypothetical protein